ncbi:MAG: DUF433 domain-containing protein [Candidatus Binatia bacterium]
MTDERLLTRIAVDPKICAGRPFIRGTRIYIAIILDALAQGFSPAEVIAHYPSLETEDLDAAVAYASRLAENNGGLAVLGRQCLNDPLQPL